MFDRLSHMIDKNNKQKHNKKESNIDKQDSGDNDFETKKKHRSLKGKKSPKKRGMDDDKAQNQGISKTARIGKEDSNEEDKNINEVESTEKKMIQILDSELSEVKGLVERMKEKLTGHDKVVSRFERVVARLENNSHWIAALRREVV